jgi:RimJ/RimL family protein N-acetyltransferase
VTFELRPAASEDTEALIDLQIAAWQKAFVPLLPPGFHIPARAEFRLMGGRALAAQGVNRTVAVERGQVVGLCTDGPSRDEDAPPEVGEIRAMFVHPDHWRRGAGKALAENALDHLRGAGFSEATLWSFADNDRANAFYEGLGFRPDGATQSRATFVGTQEIRYRRGL